MLGRIWRILRDLFVDGYSVVGAIAPALSVSFTVLKAFDAFPNLRGISYLWGLVPILVWILVAYVRRDLRYIDLEQQTSNVAARAENLAKLGKLRKDGVALRNKSIRTQQDFNQWSKDEAEWRQQVYQIAGALSSPLRSRLETLDTVGPGPRLDPGFTIEHTEARKFISEITKRVGEFLEKNQ